MPRFFVSPEQINDNTVTVSGDDAFHISRSLRMAAGEHITVCDTLGYEYDCILESFSENVTASIVSKQLCETEPPFWTTVWQALPKGDKIDSIIQKSVECGASEIRLFESKYCIVKSDAKSDQKKSERRQRIALEAAKQCGRGILPKVVSPVSFESMIKEASLADIPIFCFEGENTLGLGSIIKAKKQELGSHKKPTVSIVIGSEGGFSEGEAEIAKKHGMLMAGLGKRILRTETVSTFVLGALVCEFELG